MFGDKLKKLIPKNSEKGEQDNKKKIENLVFFIVLLIITIVIINIIWNGNKQANKSENSSGSKQLANVESNTKLNSIKAENTETTDLTTKLENILSKIQGVGEVKAFINYSESSQIVAMYNETTKTSNTEESDTSGGTRKVEEMDSQKDIIYEEDDNGIKKPITQKVIEPKLEGAIITAKGASNPEIKANIIQAVEAVTGLSTHKIQVFEMN